MKARFHLVVIGVGVVCLAVALAPAALAQENREELRDAAASGSDMLTQSSSGNVAQQAVFASGAGDRDLKKAAKLTAKLPELEGKKREAAEGKIAKAYENAQASYREALGLDPKMIEAYVGLAEAFRATGMHAETLQATTLGLRVDSANDVLFAGWAESLMALDRLGDATQAYSQLQQTNPAWAGVLIGEIKSWLVEHQADPGELAPADVEKMAVWVAEQEAAS